MKHRHTRHIFRRIRGQVRLPRRPLVVAPDPSCPIGWKPSVYAPVFYGHTDTTAILPPEAIAQRTVQAGTADAADALSDSGVAPSGQGVTSAASLGVGGETVAAFGKPLRIFYPSLDGAPQDAPMLKHCGRYPLVLFAHGNCARDEEHYKKWFELPAVLARSGYVVLVPELPLTGSGAPPSSNDAEQELVSDLIVWARTRWTDREVLMPPPATVLVGHSYGAGLVSRVAARNPGQIGAYVSLSGVEVTGDVMRSRIPKLFTVGGDLAVEVLTVPISGGVEFMTEPAHYVEFHHGGHWDYLPAGRSACDVGRSGNPERGPCTLVPLLAADLVACFLTRYAPPEGVPPDHGWWPFDFFYKIHPSLRPPFLSRLLLTREQKFFAGGHLLAWGLVPERNECGLSSHWKVAGNQGSLVHD